LPNADYLWYGTNNTTAEILRRMRFVEPAYSLRSGFIYQNVMYAAAGQVIANVSGMPWEEFVRTRIFAPLHMDRTVPLLSRAGSVPNVASPHDRVNDTLRGAPMFKPGNVLVGDPRAGAEYFQGAGGCAQCHSPSGDLAGIGNRLQGLPLLQRMLYPSGRGGDATTPEKLQAKATVTLPSGQTITGRLAYRDEFTIALTDASGWYRSWPVGQVKFTVDRPLDAHMAQLAKYTDEDMHNVLAYLQTLK